MNKIKENPLLVKKYMLVKNFLHHGCIFVCGKNLFDHRKILAYGTRKKFWLVEKC